MASITALLFRHLWEGWLCFFPFLALFALLNALDAIRVRGEGVFIDDEKLRIRTNADRVTMRWHDIICLQGNVKTLTLIDTDRGCTFSPNSFDQSELLQSLIRTRVPRNIQTQDAWKRVPWFQEVLALSGQIVQGEAPAVSYHQPQFWLSLLALLFIILVAILNNAGG